MMTERRRLFFIALNFLLLCPSYFGNAASPEWKVVWSDEFDGDHIDLNHWGFELGDGCNQAKYMCGWGNDELQWYTNNTDNAYVSNGHLVIQAMREESPDKKFTSARMMTLGKGDWLFGKIEVRAKFPYGKGIVPLIWMLPTYNKFGIWPCSGEIDIAAMIDATEGNEVQTIAHAGMNYKYRYDKVNISKSDSPKFSEDFHVFSVERYRDNLIWYIDNEVVNKVNAEALQPLYTYPFNERFHLVLSLAVGGRVSPTAPENTPFPKRLEIDYVRVYEK